MRDINSLQQYAQKVSMAYIAWQAEPYSKSKEAAYEKALKAQTTYLRESINNCSKSVNVDGYGHF